MSAPNEPIWGESPSAVLQAGPLSVRTSRKHLTVALFSLLFLASCSPRDFLTRRLATDLIVGSEAFSAPQLFVLRTGVVSSKDYAAPEYLVLQRHGWLAATAIACSPGVAPPPCWDVLLTPSGVDTVRNLVSAEDASKASIALPAARRELIAITGISKQGNTADVEFTWKWAPVNEIGDALFSGELHYKSSVGFREYDDGWRIVPSALRPGQSIDDAMKNAEPVS